MSHLHLISHTLCPYVQRAIIILSEKNIEHERTYIDLANKPDWFLKDSPLGKVPILKTKNSVLFESQVIAEYLDETTPDSLHPTDPLAKARHRSWIEFASETLTLTFGMLIAGDESSFLEKHGAIIEKLAKIEFEIKGPYFDGDIFQMIDGVWSTVFQHLEYIENHTEIVFSDALPKITAWRKLVSQRPSVQSAPPPEYNDFMKSFLTDRKAFLAKSL